MSSGLSAVIVLWCSVCGFAGRIVSCSAAGAPNFITLKTFLKGCRTTTVPSQVDVLTTNTILPGKLRKFRTNSLHFLSKNTPSWGVLRDFLYWLVPTGRCQSFLAFDVSVLDFSEVLVFELSFDFSFEVEVSLSFSFADEDRLADDLERLSVT